MKRGFPRPTMHIDTTVTNVKVMDNGGKMYRQSYGPEWDNRRYPIPYTAEEDNISTLHSGRLQECVVDKLCIACGEEVEEEIVWLMVSEGKIFSESGPFHSKCKTLTERMCPHIVLSNGKYTFKQDEWSNVKHEILARVV